MMNTYDEYLVDDAHFEGIVTASQDDVGFRMNV